ncbi:MAG: MEDS domain-containing protein, partial [Nitrososphaerota archaeon]|nr:MEDS domain-containing protein [Nitrososphaerota archaeon]
LFELCRELILRHCGVLYIAGKQGVKGIRLSLIDTGLDVSGYQRSGQMNIVDSEEWYLSSPRRIQFKSDAELENEFRRVSEETISSGYNYLVVISETDMLVRKGFLAKYAELDAQLDSVIRDLKIGFLCAFDRRELVASGVKDATLQVTVTHQTMI